MYDHIGLKVKDADASVRFYEAALKPFGYVLCSRDDSSAGFGPRGEAALWLYFAGKSANGPGLHVAFRASDRATVDRQRRTRSAGRGMAQGATCCRLPCDRRQR